MLKSKINTFKRFGSEFNFFKSMNVRLFVDIPILFAIAKLPICFKLLIELGIVPYNVLPMFTISKIFNDVNLNPIHSGIVP